jgi:pimeloyl-ACP methyl ester carboxylesterase
MNIHLEVAGAGPPLVFIHGLGTSMKTWLACRDILKDRYRVIGLDLPGHGQSSVTTDPSDYTRDRVLEQLDDVVSDLDERAVFVGHSLGGYLSLAYAATRPGALRGIVVVSTGPGFRDPVKREEWNARSRRNAHRFGLPEPVADLNLQEDSIVMDRLASIDTPILFIAGALDRPEYAASGTYIERKAPSARLVVVPEAEHSPQESHAEIVSAHIDQFVSQLAP